MGRRVAAIAWLMLLLLGRRFRMAGYRLCAPGRAELTSDSRSARREIRCASSWYRDITLGGVIDMAGGWFDPLDEDVDQSDITAPTAEHQQAADALLGRNVRDLPGVLAQAASSRPRLRPA